MNFKKYLTGISMILTSAAAFAQPNSVMLTGYFINSTSSSFWGMVMPKDNSDNANVQIAGETMSPSEPYSRFEVAPRQPGVFYSIELSSLKNYIIMRLIQASDFDQICDWYVFPKTSAKHPPIAAQYNAPECMLTGVYNFVMTKTNKQ